MKTVATIEARMTSTRLPGKVLLPLAGQPMIAQLTKRLSRSQRIDQIVIAVPYGEEKIALMSPVGNVYAGPRGYADDCLGRTLEAALRFDADLIVRVPGDNPLVHPDAVDLAVDRWSEGAVVNNIQGHGWPDGIGAWVFSLKFLQWADRMLIGQAEREHLRFHVPEDSPPCPPAYAYPDLRLDVNTKEDYEYVARIYDRLGPDCTVADIVKAGLDQR